MQKLSFPEALDVILREDRRYDIEAYLFVREALDYTVKMLNTPPQGPERHISGQELLEGIRQFAVCEYGPMALRVLNTWGVRRTADFGEIVFNLVEKGVLGKTDRDKREDFAGGYDFADAFAKPFLPPSAQARPERKNENAERQKQKTPSGNA